MLSREHLADLVRRRQEVFEFLKDKVLIIASTYEKVRNSDVNHPFRQDSLFHYLTGFPEPDTVAVFDAQTDGENYLLFVREKDRFKELWNGFLFGIEGATEIFKADKAYPLPKLEDVLEKRLANREVILICEKHHPLESRLLAISAGKTDDKTKDEFLRFSQNKRCRKSPFEISCMKKSAEISSRAHHRLMVNGRSANNECELYADFLHSCMREGALSMAYPPIVAAGANATCLHYSANNYKIERDDLILIDAGCEVNGYAADITRTFPASGKFSPLQKDCYELVLKAQQDVLDQVKPGETLKTLHNIAVKSIAEQLIGMGIIKCGLEEAIEKKVYSDYYPHGTGHWLGLDVHDTMLVKDTPLESGMVITVEPGLYFQTYNEKVLNSYLGMGIRIEDDVLITENGCEILTENCVKTVKEIEELV